MDSVLVNHTWKVLCLTQPERRLDSAYIRNYEESATRSVQESAGAHNYISSTEETQSCYAKLDWVGVDESKGSSVGSCSSSKGIKRARKAAQISQLRVQVYISEAWSSEVVVLFGNQESDEPSICLVRGKNSFKYILDWLEGVVKCDVLRTLWKPSSPEIAHIATNLLNNQVARSIPFGASLSLTFQAPLDVTGMEHLEISIPPKSLQKMMEDIEKQRPKDSQDTSLPVLKAIEYFVKESFGINVSGFSLIKASCHAASISLDGRMKPRNMALVKEVLQVITEGQKSAKESIILDEDSVGEST